VILETSRIFASVPGTFDR
jgi:cytochrome P450